MRGQKNGKKNHQPGITIFKHTLKVTGENFNLSRFSGRSTFILVGAVGSPRQVAPSVLVLFLVVACRAVVLERERR